MKRFLAIAAALLVAALPLAAQTNPISAKPITFSMVVSTGGQRGDWSDMRIFQALEKLTNVHINFIQIPNQGFEDRKNLMLATGDLPDAFWGSLNTNDEDIYGPQGYFVNLAPLIDSDAPHVKAQEQKYPLFRQTMTSSDGKIYALGAISISPTAGPFKMRINKAWLAKLGLKFPQTIDDFEAALKGFVTKDPNGNGKADEIGMSHYEGFDNPDATFLGAFGMMYGYTNHSRMVNVYNGKVTFFRQTPNYKAYLQWMAKLWSEGLIDKQIFTQSEDEYIAKTGQNILGVLSDVDDADWHQYEMLDPLTSPYNQTKLTWPLNKFASGGFAITKNNKYPHEAMRWIDVFYRDVSDPWNGFSGAAVNYGQQGVDWDYTDATRTRIHYLFDVPANMGNQTVAFTKIIGPGWGAGASIMNAPFDSDILAWAADQNAKHLFPYQNDSIVFPGAIRLDKSVADRASVLSLDLKKYMEQEQAKFISGEESFDKWNNYLAALKSIGVDEYIRILQAAYDKFNK
jgi:putative aldouronate transport system substrate-binding protein